MKSKKLWIILGAIVGFILLLVIGLIVFYKVSLKAVNDSDEVVSFVINSGEVSKNVIDDLADANLIKSKMAAYVYVKLHKDIVIQAGEYNLKRNMSTPEILNSFGLGKITGNVVNITFYEGQNLTDHLKIASKALGFDYDEALKLVDSKDYLEEKIDKYWFLTDEILDERIYHGLEGYLFADTYQFNVGSTVDDVITAMLDNLANKLEPLEDDINDRGLSIHELMTLASIVESEGKSPLDRAKVAQVFLNRIINGYSLDSDVTTRYEVGKSFQDGLTFDDLATCTNGYNTNWRCGQSRGLSVGPIASPSLVSIKAAIYPEPNDYLYFVADCSGKTYFNYTEAEHNATINKLRNEGNWCEA